MNKENNIFYVYGCYVEGVLKYVGKGKGDRYKHCVSGTSTCKELNRDFFLGKKLEVKVLHDKLNEQDALSLESTIISTNTSLYNKKGVNKESPFDGEFVMIPKVVLRASGYISPVSDLPVPVKTTEKLIYSYIYDKLHGPTAVTPFMESQETIASACGLEYRLVGRVLRSFVENGVLTATKGRVNGQGAHRWSYNWMDLTLDWWVGTEQEHQILS